MGFLRLTVGGALGEILGQGHDVRNAPGAGAALRVHDEQPGHHEHCVEDDGEVAQEGHNGAGKCHILLHTPRAHQHHGGQTGIEHKVDDGADGGHGQVGSALALGQILIHLGEGLLLHVRAGQGADHPGAGHILLDFPHHAVLPLLHAGEQRHALLAGKIDGHAQQRQGADEHQGQHRLQGQGHDDAPQQQDGRAHPQAHHAVDHVVDIVGVAGQAGHQRGFGRLVALTGGQGGDAAEQVAPHPEDKVPGHVGGHAVGDNVAHPGQAGAQKHQRAHAPYAPHIPHLGIGVQDDGQQAGQKQLHHRAAQLDQQLQADAAQIGLQVLSDKPHGASPPFT